MVRDNPHVRLLMLLGTPEMFFLSSTFSLSDHIYFAVIFIGQCDTHVHNFCTKNIKNLQSRHKYRLASSWSLLDLPHLKCVVYFLFICTHSDIQRKSYSLILPLATRSCNWCSPDIFASLSCRASYLVVCVMPLIEKWHE